MTCYEHLTIRIMVVAAGLQALDGSGFPTGSRLGTTWHDLAPQLEDFDVALRSLVSRPESPTTRLSRLAISNPRTWPIY